MITPSTAYSTSNCYAIKKYWYSRDTRLRQVAIREVDVAR